MEFKKLAKLTKSDKYFDILQHSNNGNYCKQIIPLLDNAKKYITETVLINFETRKIKKDRKMFYDRF
jgi:hypothetical protein